MKANIDEKFYAPSIEEFHVGFEYEQYDPDYQGQTGDESWKYRKCDKDDLEDVVTCWKHFQEYRVKHLDREDIESCGFKVIGGQMMSGGRIDCQKHYNDPKGFYDKAMLTFSPNQKWVMIAIGDDELPFDNWNTLFAGTIKNKSELKRILKHIGV
jgi:hypothetical protein